ncbi:MAG TPA: hypothetical protein VN258_11050 [Mobilitalea sp.]|nr:hypothetical protein [Mobilitalea sp.]
MRKYVFLLITLVFILSACEKSDNQTFTQSEDDYFTYKVDKNINSFDVDENGILYYLTFNAAEDHVEYILKTLDSKGALLNTYPITETTNKIVYGDGKIYYFDNSSGTASLYEFSLAKQISVKINDFTDYSAISQMEVIGDKLYFLGINQKNINKDYSLAEINDRFTYSGETLGCIDLNTGTLTELAVEFPISFSKAFDDNLVIYAYDENGGYYFIEYNTHECGFSKKTYHKIDMFNQFKIYNDKKDFIYIKLNLTTPLTSASIDPDKGEIELVPYFKGGEMICRGDYTYSINIDATQIVRIKNSSYICGKDKITMINTDFYEVFQPFGCGYTIEQKFLTDEEMALSLLSQDKNFDICLMNSKQTISANIRDKGSFYPLNEVEGVKEYLEACFPYIKDAATNSDGDIWMLPIAVDMPVIFYNENVGSEYGIELTDSIGLEDFFSIISKFNENTELENLYYYDKVSIMNNFFYQYLRSYPDFNNPTFEKLSKLIKKEMKYSEVRSIGNVNLMFNFSFYKEDNFIFMYNDDSSYQLGVSERNNIRACGLPYITDDKTNVATCLFLCVNPESKNLKETLQYTSSLCGYLQTLKDTMMFKDRNIYPQGNLMDDLYNIYTNGDIQFTLPDELFMDDFTLYLKGEKELQDVIKDSNRRLDAFLTE